MTENLYPSHIENLLHSIKPTLLVCGGSDEAIDDVSLEGFRRTYNLISLPTDELLEYVLQSWEPGEGLGSKSYSSPSG